MRRPVAAHPGQTPRRTPIHRQAAGLSASFRAAARSTVVPVSEPGSGAPPPADSYWQVIVIAFATAGMPSRYVPMSIASLAAMFGSDRMPQIVAPFLSLAVVMAAAI